MSPLLTHQIRGSGPPAVFLNGGMMSFPAWEAVSSRLARGRQVLLFDFRGQLLSPGPPPADLNGHCRDLLDLLDSLGWTQADLIGTSFGAEVAVVVAGREPERVRSLSLITAMERATPAFSRQSREMRTILNEIAAGGARHRFYDLLVERVYSRAYRDREAALLAARRVEVARLPDHWFAELEGLLAAIEEFDVTKPAAAVCCPTQVLIAGLDEVMSDAGARALAAATGAEIHLHAGAGHAVVAEDPAWVADRLEAFLERTSPRT
jgi:pimeloyl-ACP methyl ester carboxylesterase